MVYPINQAIQNLLESSVDEETGELKYTEEELQSMISGLQMEFDEKIDALACVAKNYKAEASDIKDEKMKLAKRQSSAEKASERTRRFLAYLLQGNKFKSARHNIYYQTAQPSLVVDDPVELVNWLKQNHPEWLNAPTPKTDEIRIAAKSGMEIPFCHLEQNRTIIVK